MRPPPEHKALTLCPLKLIFFIFIESISVQSSYELSHYLHSHFIAGFFYFYVWLELDAGICMIALS